MVSIDVIKVLDGSSLYFSLNLGCSVNKNIPLSLRLLKIFIIVSSDFMILEIKLHPANHIISTFCKQSGK